MKKLPIILILILTLVGASVTADNNYTRLGKTLNSEFSTGIGFFNTELTGETSRTKSINSLVNAPLIADLDNNGVNEIIVLDGSTFRIYNSDLQLQATYPINITQTGARYTYLIQDIDNDNFLEIIVIRDREANEQANLEIIEFNGTSIHQDIRLDLDQTTGIALESEFMIACRTDNDCIIVLTPSRVTVGFPGLSAWGFNATNISTRHEVVTIGPGKAACAPKFRTMSVSDPDNDGEEEFTFTYIVAQSGNDQVEIKTLGLQANLSPIIEMIGGKAIFDALSDTTSNKCTDQLSSAETLFTSPLVFDADGVSSNGQEAIFAANTDADEFKMFSYESVGSTWVFLDDYPEVFQADGTILSNIMLFNSFTDTGKVDFCVLGFEEADQQLDLLCASEQTNEFIETNEFFFDTTGRFNVTSTYGSYSILSHSTQHTTATIDGNNLDEVLSTYGIFELDYTGVNHLDMIWESPQANIAIISIDAEKVGREDLIGNTNTNLWYFDDGYTTSGAGIDSYSINPCIDNTWKINTSVENRLTVIDPDGDSVSARSILYFGDSDSTVIQDTGWAANSSSGTTFTFSHKANVTRGTSTLRMMAQDTSNPTEIEIIDITFSVGVNGAVFNDCTTDVTGLSVNVTPSFSDDILDANNNILTRNLRLVNSEFNFGLTLEIIYWIITLLVIGGSFFYAVDVGASAIQATIVTTMLGVGMVILGTLMGIISLGVILSMFVISIAIISFAFKNMFMGTRGD